MNRSSKVLLLGAGFTRNWGGGSVGFAEMKWCQLTRSLGIVAASSCVMTLRRYLKPRNRKVLIPGAVVTLTVVAFAAYVPKESAWKSAAAYVVLLFVVVIAIFSDRARCPKCNARLGYMDFGGGRRWGAPRAGFDRCLNCG